MNNNNKLHTANLILLGKIYKMVYHNPVYVNPSNNVLVPKELMQYHFYIFLNIFNYDNAKNLRFLILNGYDFFFEFHRQWYHRSSNVYSYDLYDDIKEYEDYGYDIEAAKALTDEAKNKLDFYINNFSQLPGNEIGLIASLLYIFIHIDIRNVELRELQKLFYDTDIDTSYKAIRKIIRLQTKYNLFDMYKDQVIWILDWLKFQCKLKIETLSKLEDKIDNKKLELSIVNKK